MPHLYLSYGRSDSREFTKRLSTWLRLLGYKPRLDTEHGLINRKPLKPAAEAAIKTSTFVIAMLTPKSIRADGIAREELRCALANNIPVLPIKIADVALPHGITGLEHLDASADPGSVFTLLPALINNILEKAGAGTAPAPDPSGKQWWENDQDPRHRPCPETRRGPVHRPGLVL